MAERRRIQPGERIAKKPDRPAGYRNLVLETSFTLEEHQLLKQAYHAAHLGQWPRNNAELLKWVRENVKVKEQIMALAVAIAHPG